MYEKYQPANISCQLYLAIHFSLMHFSLAFAFWLELVLLLFLLRIIEKEQTMLNLYRCTSICKFDIWAKSIRLPLVYVSLAAQKFRLRNFFLPIEILFNIETAWNVIWNRGIFAIFLSYSQCARLKGIWHHLSTEKASKCKMSTPTRGKNDDEWESARKMVERNSYRMYGIWL